VTGGGHSTPETRIVGLDRRFFSHPVPDRGPCLGAKLCDVISGDDVTGFDAVRSVAVLPRASVLFFGCGGTPHGRGIFAELRYVQGSAVRVREGGSKTNNNR
jgi:hypothetical protein